jgi:hypothetical protein
MIVTKRDYDIMTDYKHVFLINFNPSDLVFDEEETKEILKFFFKTDLAFIDSIAIDDRIRNFAQGILIEAIDASYAIGYIKIVFDVFYLQPPKPMRKVFTKLGRKVAMYWFKHARATDLLNIKIYEMVRSKIAEGFRWHFLNLANGLVMRKPAGAVIAYSTDKSQGIVLS